MRYFYSPNFVKSQIVPSFNQIDTKPYLLINEPQNLFKTGKGYHTEVWVCLGCS